MCIRTATERDLPFLGHLYHICFPQSQWSEHDWELDLQPNARRSLHNIHLLEIDNTIAASLVLYSHDVWIAGSKVRSGGIGGVAVLPQYRGRGFSKILINHVFDLLRAESIPISLLYPFKQSFYGKLGYSLIGIIQTLRLESKHVTDHAASRNVRRCLMSDLDSMCTCYQQFAQRSNMMIDRSRSVWQDEFEQAEKRKQQYYCFERAQKIEGFLRITDPHSKEQRLADELVYRSPEALRALIDFVTGFDQSNIVLRTGIDEGIHFIVDDPIQERSPVIHGLTHSAGEIGCGLMARIIHVTEALSVRPFNNVKGEIAFQLNDPIVQENNLTVAGAFQNNRFIFKPTKNQQVIRISISAFSQLYCGALSFTDAIRLGLLSADFDVGFLDHAFRIPKPNCFDYF